MADTQDSAILGSEAYGASKPPYNTNRNQNKLTLGSLNGNFYHVEVAIIDVSNP